MEKKLNQLKKIQKELNKAWDICIKYNLNTDEIRERVLKVDDEIYELIMAM